MLPSSIMAAFLSQSKPIESSVLWPYVTGAHRQLMLGSKMSAMFPMCVRASRSVLRFRSGTLAASSPQQVLDIIRPLSTEKNPAGTGGATGGLAQAILQERLQQQQQNQEGEPGEKDGEQAEDKKQKENTAYAKKMVLRLAGLMGLGGANIV
ncbi:Mitochondrial import inner membrane translocase subunit TIM50 [Goodea atripinnis]|uniref:Mitochondrial import inner membrane translocase subunit TIM50 n=1 Tax=Goodea atripinnis TaxID=208336 RepID=A0ABV0PSR0_9TELE